MSTITATRGTDTWVRDDHPNRNYAGGNTIRLEASHRRGFLHIPVTDVRGRTVLSATLTGRVRGTFAAQTVTVAAVTDSWSAGKVTWNRQPSAGSGISTVITSQSDGTAVDLDVTAIVQAVANGTKWRGLRLSTSATGATDSLWYAFDAPQPAWTLTVELSDAPEQPTDLRPNIGAVASSAPMLAWSYTDLGGDSSEQGSFRVQVDPDADPTTPAFDTGWVTSADPEYNLSSGTFTPLTSGDATQWRVATKDAAGNISEWSDWAAFSYAPYPTLTVDSPTGGVIGDATPDVIFHLTGETLTQWRVVVLDSAGTELWNSGLSDGVGSVTVPARNSATGWKWLGAGFKVISRDDATYFVDVYAYGDVDRADAVGLPGYVSQRVTVVFDEDAGVVTPGDFTAAAPAAGDPRITFTWTRTEAPDAVLILDGADVYARLDADDWTLDAGTYTWTDRANAQPFTQHAFTIRAVESGVRSAASSVVDYSSAISDVWLVPDDGAEPIRLETKASLDQFGVVDRRATYKPLDSSTNVSIVYGLEGVSGTFTGFLSWRQDQPAAVARLNAIREDVAATPRLVWGASVPVQVSNLKVLPAADYTAAQVVYNVSFDFIQDGD